METKGFFFNLTSSLMSQLALSHLNAYGSIPTINILNILVRRPTLDVRFKRLKSVLALKGLKTYVCVLLLDHMCQTV